MKEKLLDNKKHIIKKTRVAKLFGYSSNEDLINNLPYFDSWKFDLTNIPIFYKWLLFLTSLLFFMTVFLVILYYNYKYNRSTNYLSNNPNSGDCTLLSFPQTVTGEFSISDAGGSNNFGLWNTNAKYNPNLNRYSITLNALTFTTSQWQQNMFQVKQKLIQLASKTTHRDFAFSIIAWNAFKAIKTEVSTGGSCLFKLAGSPQYTFNKAYPVFGIGSANGVLNQNTKNSCNQEMTVNFDHSSAILNIQIDIGNTTSFSPACENLGLPQALGYNEMSQNSIINLDYNMNALVVAVAVNYGMISLKSLTQKAGNLACKKLLNKMVQYNYISQEQAEATSTYFDPTLSSDSLVYCVNWTSINSTYSNLASCFLRVGNTLMYPVVQSSGIFYKESFPKRCIKYRANVKDPQTLHEKSAKYYCNLMNLNIGFVYYPNTDMISNPTLSPASQPNNNAPTPNPTHRPTISMAPTYVQGNPTPLPSQKPTKAPSQAPTMKPSNLPSLSPSRYHLSLLSLSLS